MTDYQNQNAKNTEVHIADNNYIKCLFALPKINPYVENKHNRSSSRIFLSKKQLAINAQEYHRRNPEFIKNILRKINVIKNQDEENLAIECLEEAIKIGLFSKKDLIYYITICMNINGSLSNIPKFRRFIERSQFGDRDIIQEYITNNSIQYWATLKTKMQEVKNKKGDSYDRSL